MLVGLDILRPGLAMTNKRALALSYTSTQLIVDFDSFLDILVNRFPSLNTNTSVHLSTRYQALQNYPRRITCPLHPLLLMLLSTHKMIKALSSSE